MYYDLDGLPLALPGIMAGTSGFNFRLLIKPDAWNPANIAGSDIGALFVSVIARLVTADFSKPDQRSIAKLYMGVGADMSPDSKSWSTVSASKYKQVTSDYQAFNMITMTTAQILATPPPVLDSNVPVSAQATPCDACSGY